MRGLEVSGEPVPPSSPVRREAGVHPVIELVGVEKHYRMGDTLVKALQGIDLRIDPGDYISILGRPVAASRPCSTSSAASISRAWAGISSTGRMSRSFPTTISRRSGKKARLHLQSYNLIQQLTVVENIEVPLYYQGVPERESRRIAVELAQRVGSGSVSTTGPPSFPEGSNSGSRLPARSRTIPPSSSPTRPPATSTRNPAATSSRSSTPSTRKERRSFSSPTTRAWRTAPRGRSA